MTTAGTFGSSSSFGHAREVMLALVMTALAAAIYLTTDNPMVPIAAAGVPAAALLCYRSPLPICVLFIAFSFFRVHEAYPALEGLNIPLALGIMMLSCVALHVFIVKSIEPVFTPELKRLLVMFAVVVAGIAFAKDRTIAWSFVSDVYWKIILMTFAIAWLARTDADFNFVARTLVISGTLVAAVAIYNKIYGIDLVEGTRVTIGRAIKRVDIEDWIDPLELKSTLSDPNDLSLVLLFPLAFSIALIIYRSSRFNTLLGLISSATIMLAIIFTQSRGGLIGVMAVLGVLGLRLIKSRSVVISLCVIAGLGLGVAMGLKARQSGGEAEISESGIDDSAMGRIYAWKAALNMAAQRPLTGVGIANFRDSYFFFTDHWENRDKAVHSTWFQVIGETGIPGTIVFFMLVIATFKSAIANLGRLAAAGAPPILTATALSLVSGLAGFCAAGTFLTQVFNWPLYVLIGLTAAVSRASTIRVAQHGVDTNRVTRSVPAIAARPPFSARPALRGLNSATLTR